ncbi:MAG TPA: SELO family protein, partial [Campylobacterales bacterium]|nr:SELO family protein [Campylobacterales bacterium]
MKLNEIEVTNPYLNLDDEFYDKVKPTPLNRPHLIHANASVAKTLGIDEEELQSDNFVRLLNGEFEPKGY